MSDSSIQTDWIKHVEQLITADGSHSLYSKQLDETYHSKHGAIAEALYVYLKSGFQEQVKNKTNSISILEMGFGTGLNALLSAMAAREIDSKIVYYAIEKYPLSDHIISSLNYADNLKEKKLYVQLLSSEWGSSVAIHSKFQIKKVCDDILNHHFHETFDLIYYDAFAPRVQPELWTISIFEKLFSICNPNAILVTYCAKGEVKRNLRAAGFSVESIAGPPGKREMIRAKKIISTQ